MKNFVEILNEVTKTSTINEAYIDLDWAGEQDPSTDTYVKKANLKVKSLGNDEYRFTGKKSDIEKYLYIYNSGDKDEVEWMKDQIVETAKTSTINEAYIDLDWAGDQDPSTDTYVKKANLKVTDLGDGTYRFSGNVDDIKNYLMIYNGDDKKTTESMYDKIKTK